MAHEILTFYILKEVIFQRSFTFPKTVDSEKINAKYDNGVLKLTLSKKEEAKAKPPRDIKIG